MNKSQYKEQMSRISEMSEGPSGKSSSKLSEIKNDAKEGSKKELGMIIENSSEEMA